MAFRANGDRQTEHRQKESSIMNNTQMNLNKNKFNSDVQKYAMSVFDDIICRVRRSNLNFQLQLSPFSAVISLKKSVVKNSEGVQIIPEPKEIEADNDALQRSYADAIEKLEAAGKKIQSLEDQLAELSRTQKEPKNSKKDICDPVVTVLATELSMAQFHVLPLIRLQV